MTLWSVEELRARLDDPRLRLADVRWVLGRPGAGRRAYDEGHIPGAIHLDLDTDLADHDGLGAPGRHPLPDPTAFAKHLARLGIGDDHAVVAYDEATGGNAARLWWMLDDLGHRDVHLLDGGLAAWVAAGLPLTTEVPDWPPTRLSLAPRWSRVIERDDLAARLGSVVLLDARVGERYRGEIEPIDPVAGHIPTALSAPSGGSLTPEGRFLPPDVLAERFRGLGAARAVSPAGAVLGADEPEVVSYCGSGVTACHTAFAMRLAGLAGPTIYAGSYSDWSRSGMPIATGPEAGSRPDQADRSARP